MNDDLQVNGNADPFDLDGSGGGAGAGVVNLGAASDGGTDAGKKGDPWAAIESLTNLVTKQNESISGLAEAIKTRPAIVPPEGQPRREEPAAGGGPAGFPAAANPILLELQSGMQSGHIKSTADVEAFWDRKFVESPGKAAVASQQLAQIQAQSVVASANGPLQETQAYGQLDNWRREHLSDPMFLNPEVRKEFDALIDAEKTKGSFKNLTALQVSEGLDHVYEMAIGRTARRRALGSSASARETRSNVPPVLPSNSGGGGFGGAGGGGGGGGRNLVDMTPRNEIERQLLESAREYAMSPEDTAESLRQLREDQSA